MTPEDANRLLALAKANYSYAFRSMTKQEKVMLVQSWAFALQDIPADIVTLAFMELLTTCKWLPTVAEIREQIKSLHYRACQRNDLMPETPEVRRAKDYIAANTCALRGEGGSHQLSLDSILSGPYMTGLGSGKMDLPAIDAQSFCLPEAEDDGRAFPDARERKQ